MLRRIKIDLKTYNAIIDNYKPFIVYEDINNYIATGYPNKELIRVDTNTNTLICQASILNFVSNVDFNCQNWLQIVCKLDDSIEETKEEYIPYGKDAYKKLIKYVTKYYTDDEIYKIMEEHSLFDGKRALHKLLPEKYLTGNIYKFTDCVYYDINGAHRDALIELFPKAKKELLKLDKAYINIAVGELCNEDHRGVYNWIVNRTREYIDEIIKVADGEIIYANTDGVIIHHPANYLATSKEIGAFKSEIIGDTIYGYFCEGDDKTTQYTIYQYIDKNGKTVLKGNARYLIRNGIKGMDLSKGLVNKGKMYKDENKIWRVRDLRQEEIEIYEED